MRPRSNKKHPLVAKFESFPYMEIVTAHASRKGEAGQEG